jgi:ubiquinone/menaquinone biosynthesis C-methylase UbiE
MAAHYDQFDYPGYWAGRDYENASEIIAIKNFLAQISRIKTVLDIGAGYGRLTPAYQYRAKKIILSDPSSKLLSVAKKKLNKQNIKYLHSKIENLCSKIRPKSVDLVLMVRVLHHLTNIDVAFEKINRMLDSHGYFILEFANKRHFKACISEFCKGNFTYPSDIFPKDRRCAQSVKNNALPFVNYHPDLIMKKLSEHGFEIVEKRSISNIRIPLAKKLFTLDLLQELESFLQKPLSLFNFGPSIMLLARKID